MDSGDSNSNRDDSSDERNQRPTYDQQSLQANAGEQPTTDNDMPGEQTERTASSIPDEHCDATTPNTVSAADPERSKSVASNASVERDSNPSVRTTNDPDPEMVSKPEAIPSPDNAAKQSASRPHSKQEVVEPADQSTSPSRPDVKSPSDQTADQSASQSQTEPEVDLNDKEFLDQLQDGDWEVSKELEQWRHDYDVTLEDDDVSLLLGGEVSLTGLGFTKEEEDIVEVVIKEKVNELRTMSLDELVDFIKQV